MAGLSDQVIKKEKVQVTTKKKFDLNLDESKIYMHYTLQVWNSKV